jgi:hypothetical protein
LSSEIDFAEGAITNTSEAMPEAAMPSYLQKAGASEKDIIAWIEQSRKYPG